MRKKALFTLMAIIVFGGLSVVVLRAGLEPGPETASQTPEPKRPSEPAMTAPIDAPSDPVVPPSAEPTAEPKPQAQPVPSPVDVSAGQFVQYQTEGLAVRDIAAAADEAWIATTGGVVRYRLRSSEATLFDNANGLRSSLAVHVRVDPALGVMVGTIGGGLSLFDGPSATWRHLSIADGLPDPFVAATLRSRSGDLWIATWSGVCQVAGGAIDDDGAWSCYDSTSTAGGLPNSRVHALIEDNTGGIWAGTEAGIARFQGGIWRGWTHADGLGADRSETTLAAEAALSGLSIADALEIGDGHPSGDDIAERFKTQAAGFNPQFVTSMIIDADGRLWAGTWGGGLAQFQNELWRNFTEADGLPSDHIHALGLSPSGALLVGTNAGLAMRAGGEFQTVTTGDGLVSNVVLALTADPAGAIWVGGPNGATRFLSGALRPNG